MKHVLLGLALVAIVLLAGCKANEKSAASTGSSTSATAAPPAATPAPETAVKPESPANAATDADLTTTPSGLKYKDLVAGDGPVAETGMTATVHYTGWLTDGTKFDSSLDRGQPFSFQLGAGQVIRGWDEGVKGMRVGGKRKLVIPSNLGYGSQGAAGVIPPGATLVFEVQLLGVK